jgi:uncharacterized protein YodC (DUF2158 family)
MIKTGDLVRLKSDIDAPRMLVENSARLEYWYGPSVPILGPIVVHVVWFVRGELHRATFAEDNLILANDSWARSRRSPLLSKQHLQANQDHPDYQAGFEFGLRNTMTCNGLSPEWLSGNIAALEVKAILAKQGIWGVKDMASLFRAMDAIPYGNKLDLALRDVARREKAPYSDLKTHKQIQE